MPWRQENSRALVFAWPDNENDFLLIVCPSQRDVESGATTLRAECGESSVARMLVWIIMAATAGLLWQGHLIVWIALITGLSLLAGVFALVGNRMSPAYTCCGAEWTTAECGVCHKDLHDIWDYLCFGCLFSVLFVAPILGGAKLLLHVLRTQ